MTSPQCLAPANRGFNSNGIVDRTSGAPIDVHESLYRFFPATTERTEEATTIEKVDSRFARLCTSSCSSCSNVLTSPSPHGTRVMNGISDKRQKVIKNIYNNGDAFVFPRSPKRDSKTGNAAQQQQNTQDQDDESTEPAQLLFLVRHGQTDMNAAGRLQGRSVDVPLNATGRRQADELGLFLRNVPFGAVMASSLTRAHETALRVLTQNIKWSEGVKMNTAVTASDTTSSAEVSSSDGELGAFPTSAGSTPPADVLSAQTETMVAQDADLDELSWGVLEGQDMAQEPWKGTLGELKGDWDDGHFDRSAEGGESLLQVEARSRRALEALLDQGHEVNLVVSHGRTLRILLLSLSGQPLHHMTRIGKVLNTGLYVFETRRVGPGGVRSFRLLSPDPPEKPPLKPPQNEAVPQQP